MSIHQNADIYLEYIRLQLTDGNEYSKKRALQDLCEFCRRGHRIRTPSAKQGLELVILGLLNSKNLDEQTTMWAYNALAFVGTEVRCRDTLLTAASSHEDKPMLQAAAIGALTKICRSSPEFIEINAVPRIISMLGALRYLPDSNINISDRRVNVEKSSDDVLRLSLVLVGMNAAPANLFDPAHQNSTIVKELGGHDAEKVKQYSAWATAENEELGYESLGIPFDDIDKNPPNVRAWVYETIAKSAPRTRRTIEMIEYGSRDSSARTRAGLAHGLRDVHIDGVETILLDWLRDEADSETQRYLHWHITKHASIVPSYREESIRIYRSFGPDSQERRNLQAAAAQTDLYADFRRIDFESEVPLFDRQQTIINIQELSMGDKISIGGNVQGSIISNEEISDIGKIEFENKIINETEFIDTLQELLSTLNSTSLSDDEISTLKELAETAIKSRNRSALGKVRDFLFSLNSKIVAAVNSGQAWGTIAGALATAAI